MMKLVGLQFKIMYKKGPDNRAADALSRCIPSQTSEVFAVSTCVPAWFEQIVHGYEQDSVTQELLTKACVNTDPACKFQLKDGLLRYQGRLWVGNNADVQLQIMQALHSSAVGGHSGFQVTYSRIRKLFAWPGMKQSIRDFVANCTVCAQAKPEHVRYPGLLQPLPVTSQAWQVV